MLGPHSQLGFSFRAPDLERELLSIDREEKKLIVEIKAAARNGNEKGAKLLARSLVRLRGQQTKVLASAAQLRGVRAAIGVKCCLLQGVWQLAIAVCLQSAATVLGCACRLCSSASVSSCLMLAVAVGCGS